MLSRADSTYRDIAVDVYLAAGIDGERATEYARRFLLRMHESPRPPRIPPEEWPESRNWILARQRTQLGRALRLAGRYEEAVDTLELAVEVRGLEPKKVLAETYEDLGRYEDAFRLYRDVLEIDYADSSAMSGMARSYRGLHGPEADAHAEIDPHRRSRPGETKRAGALAPRDA